MEYENLSCVTRLDPAAFLHLKGFRLVTVKPDENDPSRGQFFFVREPGFDESLAEFFSGQGLVEPMAYLRKLRDLKGLAAEIFAGRKALDAGGYLK